MGVVGSAVGLKGNVGSAVGLKGNVGSAVGINGGCRECRRAKWGMSGVPYS